MNLSVEQLRMILRTSFPIPIAFLIGIPSLIGYFGIFLQWSDYSSDKLNRTPASAYDFVVVITIFLPVGGGSAGCVVAARLSENPEVSVLLLEAGGNPNPISFVPLAVPFLQNHPATDWQYKIVPLKTSENPPVYQPLSWPRGKGLGGSSTTNFMIYMRGNPKDFDQWANITDDSTWSYANVEKYFNKMEDYHGRYEGLGDNHGKNGPLRIEPLKYSPGLENILAAVKEVGFSVRDLNVNQQEGFSPIDFTQKQGRRHSAYSAYIQPILGRPNLKILRYSHVTKIKPLVNLPVGKNLADHVLTYVGPFIVKKKGNVPVSLMQEDVTFKSLADFVFNGNGPLTSTLGLLAAGVTCSSTSPGWPNLLYLFLSLSIYDGFGATIDRVSGSGNYTKDFLQPFIGNDAHFVALSPGKPKSRGFIELLDNNPFSKPIINPQYYSDSGNQDIQDMIEGYETIVNLYENTNALGNKLGARLVKIPSCSRFEFKTRSYYECAIRTAIRTLFHPVGTNSMGKIGDPHAVVDSQLREISRHYRVLGTRGLRVIDASIMPEITNANTNAPTIMIGEVGADLIKRAFHLN
ncbi:Glucose dehydrogenase [FAD, quinone] [Orchesella cincta]|uniref:Glucose dehydrogenase [FAD, quinone] n=1 Tax=Orchesella cincta TaxID=48709 RepID=A0A1D2M6G7_ORCCI|nr:Glucose dehydrogenase [FAD, quinone] [Orchesella cincta]